MSDSKPSFGWGHININVSNLERSIAFYEKLGFVLFLPAIPYLGMKKDNAQPLSEELAEALGIAPPPSGRACIMQLDDGFPKLDLTEFSNTESLPPLTNADRGLVRICLISEDLQADVERLRAEGVEFLSDVQAGHDQLGDVALCRDPDGTLIELLQVYLERWAPYLDGSA
ncbi:MAG: VOC family protein [Pseudomonadota bacterium]